MSEKRTAEWKPFVAIEAEGHGRHASGQNYDQKYHFLLVIRDGKVAEMKEYFDTEHARQVLLTEG